MSVLAACTHKSEWICPECARCPTCCECQVEPPNFVHINTREAAMALASWAKKRRKELGLPEQAEQLLRKAFPDA